MNRLVDFTTHNMQQRRLSRSRKRSQSLQTFKSLSLTWVQISWLLPSRQLFFWLFQVFKPTWSPTDVLLRSDDPTNYPATAREALSRNQTVQAAQTTGLQPQSEATAGWKISWDEKGKSNRVEIKCWRQPWPPGVPTRCPPPRCWRRTSGLTKKKQTRNAGMLELLGGHRGGKSKTKYSFVGAIRGEISGIKVIDSKWKLGWAWLHPPSRLWPRPFGFCVRLRVCVCVSLTPCARPRRRKQKKKEKLNSAAAPRGFSNLLPSIFSTFFLLLLLLLLLNSPSHHKRASDSEPSHVHTRTQCKSSSAAAWEDWTGGLLQPQSGISFSSNLLKEPRCEKKRRI